MKMSTTVAILYLVESLITFFNVSIKQKHKYLIICKNIQEEVYEKLE